MLDRIEVVESASKMLKITENKTLKIMNKEEIDLLNDTFKSNLVVQKKE